MNWAIEHSRTLASADTVNAFGLIAYSATHANIAKVLLDKQYWAALDEVSGDRWYVFAAVADSGGAAVGKGGAAAPKVSFDRLKAVDRPAGDNLALLPDFGLDARKDLPCLLVFGVDDSGDVFRVTMGLDDTSVEKAFQGLREAIGTVTDAIDAIARQNFANTQGVFAAIHLEVANFKDMVRLKKGFPFLSLFARLLSRLS